MPSKRRNNGRSKHGRGHTRLIKCSHCGGCVSKDKAVKRFNVRNIIDSSSNRDIREACAYDSTQYSIPKHYIKQCYCVSCAIHNKIVRVRSREKRKERENTRPDRERPQGDRRPFGQGGGGGGFRPPQR
eukprot:GHVU01229549.1.p2 GENE.GHVU01229549.1~~GHVU01229549.1.p2  ORF type:complete len:129 (+),score=11.52 GHVU01229549.1:690-1076(+)